MQTGVAECTGLAVNKRQMRANDGRDIVHVLPVISGRLIVLEKQNGGALEPAADQLASGFKIVTEFTDL